MSDIAQKIKQIRKQQGMAQEELAARADLNLRTVQRLESGDSEPRGKTLQLLATALEVEVSELVETCLKEDRGMLTLLHLSPLGFFLLPLGNVLLPLVIWLTQKDKVAEIRASGAEILNFQLVWTALIFLSATLLTASKIMHFGGWNFLFYVILGLLAANAILSVIGAIKTYKRQNASIYPQWIKLVR